MDEHGSNSIDQGKLDGLVAFMKGTAEAVNKEIKEYLTNQSSPRSLQNMLGRSGYKFDSVAIEKAVLEPSQYILESGGKRIRPLLLLAVLEAFGKNPNEYIEFSIIPEIIHTGTLIHDDIEDGSDLRRNRPTIHKKYGLDVAINLGDFMFFFPMVVILDSKKLSRSTKMKILDTYQRDMLNIGLGQGIDLAWHRHIIDPLSISEENYMQTAFSKTGVLTGMAAKIGAIIGGATKRQVKILGRYGATLGVAFQLQDDVLNITESKVAENKGVIGEDIKEGQVTLLVVHALKKLGEQDKKRLSEIICMHTSDPALISEAIGLIKKSGAIEYVDHVKDSLVKKCIDDLDKALPESEAKERLKLLAHFVVSRSI
ncbi:MAG: polyprenyl synthetase family protein [Candidatus Marsarchaeota archaeon]|jgi:geranylgeranyl pyrophosphate synthase|nr:polyprenyl synthetase family protein [Candidatus Marsarchaeota archaeon]MCL5418624.1 polyprenyl synthetase family protein [Candidatus Marsarchaeota archaeon]